MCGRYSLASDYDAIDARFSFSGSTEALLDFKPRFNIAPTQEVLTVIKSYDEWNEPRMMRWGLIPSWAKDASLSNRMINARAETIAYRPAFKQALVRRRCLVVADGFYEWRREGGYKIPMRIILRTGELFGFAGLWESWKSPKGNIINSCTIITTAPNRVMASIHNRMPVILPKEAEASWLDNALDPAIAQSLLLPYPSKAMEAYEISSLVNSPRNDTSDVVIPF
ncbi:SOS response-associated peptidase [Dehalococcoidia bacterium]|nr:SOS response-associated peptidase [Dehalococcoidia bacterium]